MKSLTFIEIDVPSFVPQTPEAITTWRFAQATDYLPRGEAFDAIPSVTSVAFTPATISLGQDLGMRASLKVSFADHRHIMAAEPFTSGTFWGKWRARYGTRLRGRPIRWINGLLGQSLEQMEIRHFIIDSTDGPTPQGQYTITAKDALKLADGDRAQAPVLSQGSLVGAIDADDTTLTLTPAGIGNARYPASGHVALGGEEIVAFTRDGDVMTITRGQFNTAPAQHDAGARVQLCRYYQGEDPADIIADLFITYAGIPPAYIPLGAWKQETAAYLQRVYTALIAEPTDVVELVSELVEQAALAIWWDPIGQQVRLQVLRAILTTADRFTERNTLEGSLQVQEQPGARVSQVWTYFGLRNPLEPLDEPKNFRSAAVSIAPAEQAGYGSEAIRKIFSRWIPFGGRNIALRLNNIVLGRYKDPPRRFQLAVQRYNGADPLLGGGYRIESWSIQNIDGTPGEAPVQITRLNPRPDRFEIEAEEMLFQNLDPTDLVNRVIIVDANSFSLNMRTMHDELYPEPTGTENPPITVTCIVEAGVKVGSASTSLPAFNVGDWPAGVSVTVKLLGRIQGRGGRGGNGGQNASGLGGGAPGDAGGTALYTRHPVNLILNAGGTPQVWGGGGGGGGGAGRAGGFGSGSGGGGGGGAGTFGGDGGSPTDDDFNPQPGNAGTAEAGGAAGAGGPSSAHHGGDGGGPGLSGVNAPNIAGGAGGAAGLAIDGVSFIAKTGAGDIRGAQIN